MLRIGDVRMTGAVHEAGFIPSTRPPRSPSRESRAKAPRMSAARG